MRGCSVLLTSCGKPQVMSQAADEHPSRQPLVEAVEKLAGTAVAGKAVERSNEEQEKEQVLRRERHRDEGRGWC